MPNRWLVFLLLSCVARAANATDSPRALVAGVAVAIEDHYFDAARGHEIAEGLREKAQSGAFDAVTGPDALAAALTAYLKPLDRHFRVKRGQPGDPMRRAPVDPWQSPPGTNWLSRADVVPGNVGVLALREFADFEFGRDDQPARKALDAALQRLSGTDALVVDLRGNRGGSPAMVGYLASAFTARDADIFNIFHSREGTQSEAPQEWYATPRPQLPLYVVIDARTGSAAESFAYTLQQSRRATIVGEPSGGAANPGGPVATREGLVVFVPTGSPVNPFTHGNWEGVGVQPDVRTASHEALDTALELARKAAGQQ